MKKLALILAAALFTSSVFAQAPKVGEAGAGGTVTGGGAAGVPAAPPGGSAGGTAGGGAGGAGAGALGAGAIAGIVIGVALVVGGLGSDSTTTSTATR